MTYLLLVFDQILYGLNLVGSKVILKDVNPFAWSLTRFSVTILTLLPIVYYRWKKSSIVAHERSLTKSTWPKAMWLGLWGVALTQIFFLKGLAQTNVANASLINSTIPVLTLSLSMLSGKEPFGWRKICGLIISFAGILIYQYDLSAGKLEGLAIGDLYVFLACFSTAIYITTGGDFFRRHDPYTGALMVFFAGLVWMVLYGLVAGNLEMAVDQVSSAPWGQALFRNWGVFCLIGGTAMAYGLGGYLMPLLPPSRIALFAYLQPLVGAVAAWFFLLTPFPQLFFPCLMILFIGMLVSRS